MPEQITENDGFAFYADGEPNFYSVTKDGNWFAKIQFNGEFSSAQQEEFVKAVAGSASTIEGFKHRAELAEAERDAVRDDRFDGLWRFWNDKAYGYLNKIMHYRQAMENIIKRSHIDPLGSSKVIDMRRIAEDALSDSTTR